MKKLGKYFLGLSFLLILLVPVIADAQGIPTEVPDINGKHFKVFGYSIAAKNAAIEPMSNEGQKSFKVSLYAINKQFLWVADRPHRNGGNVTPEEFMTRWSNQDYKKGYAINLPNGSISGSIKKSRSFFVVHGTFKSAYYDSKTNMLTFYFVPFDENDLPLKGYQPDSCVNAILYPLHLKMRTTSQPVFENYL